MKWSVGVPIGSMGLVYFTYMCHKKSTKCRQIYQSHGCYGVVWLVAWCVLATLKLNFTPPQKQDTHPKNSHIVLKSTQFSVGRLFGAKKIGADANDPNNPRDIWVCALDLRSFLGRFLNPSTKGTRGFNLVGRICCPCCPYVPPRKFHSLRSYVKFLEEHTSVSLESAAEDSLKISKLGIGEGNKGNH